jgi:hypothetical protein
MFGYRRVWPSSVPDVVSPLRSEGAPAPRRRSAEEPSPISLVTSSKRLRGRSGCSTDPDVNRCRFHAIATLIKNPRDGAVTL